MTAPVHLAPVHDLAGVQPGGVVVLRGDEARHALRVRRMRAGERVDLVDGMGRRVMAEVQVAEVAAGELRCLVVDVVDEAPAAPRLMLVQALAKGGRDEQAVESATEIGVHDILPWQSQRCVSVWSGHAKQERGRVRWQAVAAEAAKQSRRAWVPQVRPVAVGSALLTVVREVVAAGGLVLVLHEEGDVPISAVDLPGAGLEAGSQVVVIVGPEGGIDAQETAELREAGARVVRLGPHVLRSSTAGPVALTILAYRLGLWNTGDQT